MFKIREPFAAGALYEKEAGLLRSQIEKCFRHKLGPKGMKTQPVVAGVVPHNSIESSGPIAAWLYSRLEKANFIILGAAHRPIKSRFAIMKEGLWKTPLGELAIDTKMADKISDCELVEYDSLPHQNEHSIEVQLPFLHYKFGNDFKLVPILVYNQFADESFLDNCYYLGETIANSIKTTKDKWVVIASSDFSQDKKFNNMLLKDLVKFRGKKLFDKIKGNEAKVCGFGCIATAISVAKNLGAENSKLLKYANASEVMSNSGSTGYASLIFY